MTDEISKEQYTMGYGVANEDMKKRSVDVNAAFLTPYLRPGMDLLDCGCGPGTITLGLATLVSPGHATGIDIQERQVEMASKAAEEQSVPNVRFEVGSIYEIPFPDESFDAAFVHAVMEHISEPIKALREVWRVLRPGGVVGLRSPDFDGDLFMPENDLLKEHLALFCRLTEHNGGNRRVGKHLKTFLREAGFLRVEGSATFHTEGTLEQTRERGQIVSEYTLTPPFSQQVKELGWTDQTKLEKMAAAWHEWGEHPDALWAHAWGEAVGWKE